MSTRAFHWRWLYLLVSIGCLGCGSGPTDWPVAQDLIAGTVLADSWTETRSIDLGSLASRRYLVSGWSEDQWDRQRFRTFVRGFGDRSVLRFDLIRPRPLILRFHAGSKDSDSGGVHRVEVVVNGFPVDIVQIEGRPRRYRLPVSSGVLRAGSNELTFRYQEPDGSEREPLAWYEIEFLFSDEVDPPLPFVTADGVAVMIPFGSRIEYYLELPLEAVLTVEQVHFVGQAGGQLTLLVEQDGQPITDLSWSDRGDGGFDVPLPTVEPRIARLTLRADHPDADLSGRSGVMLSSAVIRSQVRDSTTAEKPLATSIKRSVDRPNILLYLVDTLRADHLGLYGYARPVTPRLDRFAANATVFDHAIAQSSWTRASMASIFTGLWPLKHAANGRKDVLDPKARTLAEILSASGYQTVAQVRNWNVFPVFGFRQGFEEFRRIREGKAKRVNRYVEDFLTARDQERPFFLWVHTVDPHEPYRPPTSTRDRFMEEGQDQYELDKHPGFKITRKMSEEERQSVVRYLFSLYDAEIAFNDEAFGDLVSMLENLELLDSTLVIFASDHGEEFLEHGSWGHGRNLHAENLNVPLIIRFPDRGQGRRVQEVVQHIDLLPTILDFLGLPIPDEVEGRSLVSLVDADERTGSWVSRPAFSFLHLDGAPNRSIVDGQWKLVQRLAEDGAPTWTGLFHRLEDPGERDDRSLEYPIRVRYMETLLDAKMREGSLLTTEEAVLDEETEKALKALGYLQ